MADGTGIEWTDATWNPVTGCAVVSPGCTNCYAMKLAGTRLKHTPSRQGLTVESKAGPVWNGQVRLNAQWLDQPLRWRRPRKVFVCAHGDLFAENVPDEWIDRVFAVMALAPQHTFQVLTKRSARMRAYVSDPAVVRRVYELACDMVVDEQLPVVLMAPGIGDPGLRPDWPRIHLDEWPLPHVWLGVSAEDQTRADARVPDLLATPAAIRFVSAEPLLGPIDFADLPWPKDRPRFPETDDISDGRSALRMIEGTRLDWIIFGGESGPGARPMHPAWARQIRHQCAAAGVPFFFKQWGAWAPISHMSEEQIDACYHPAPQTSPEPARREKVESIVLHQDGTVFRGDARYHRPAFEQGSGAMTMFKLGKKTAGRLLDGVEHSEFPIVEVPLS